MRTRFALFVLFGLCAGARADVARDGELDPGYGSGGIALHSSARNGAVALDLAYDAVLQADGKLLLAGRGRRLDGGQHAPQEPMVVRLADDGTLDASYGVGGVSVFPLAAPEDSEGGTARAAAFLSDGRLLVVGLIRADGGLSYRRCQLVYALDANGNVDGTYGPGPGPVCTDFGHPAAPPGSSNAIYDAVGLAVGAVGAAAYISGPVTLNAPGDSVIARLDSQGRFDPTFAVQGRLFLDNGTSILLHANTGLHLMPDNGVMAAASRSSLGAVSLGALRLDSAGTPVPGFGTGGFAGSGLEGQLVMGHGMDIDALGAPVVTGLARYLPPASQADRCNFCVLRFTTNGSPDPGFNVSGTHPGAPGTAEISFPSGTSAGNVQALRLRENGSFLLAGVVVDPAQPGVEQVGLASLLANGVDDPRFGEAATPGRLSLNPAGVDRARSIPWDVVMLPGKRAIVVGSFCCVPGGGPSASGIFAFRLQDDGLFADGFDGS